MTELQWLVWGYFAGAVTILLAASKITNDLNWRIKGITSDLESTRDKKRYWEKLSGKTKDQRDEYKKWYEEQLKFREEGAEERQELSVKYSALMSDALILKDERDNYWAQRNDAEKHMNTAQEERDKLSKDSGELRQQRDKAVQGCDEWKNGFELSKQELEAVYQTLHKERREWKNQIALLQDRLDVFREAAKKGLI